MTARHAISLFLLGFGIDIIGALFKIQHWPGASALLIVAAVCQAAALLVLVFKVLRYPGLGDFLDR